MSQTAKASSPAPRPSLRRRVLVGTSTVMLGRFVSMATMVGVTAILARRLDDGEMSAYLLASFLVPFISHFVNMGTTDLLLRIVRKSHLDANPRLAGYGVTACVKLMAVNGVIYSLLFVVVARVISIWVPTWVELSKVAIWVVLWVMLFSCCQIVAELFRGRDRFAMSGGLFSSNGGWLSNTLILAGLTVYAAGADDMTLSTVLAIHVAMIAITLGVGVVVAWPLLKAGLAPEESPPAPEMPADGSLPARPSVRWLLRETWPLFVWAGTLLTIDQIDILVVSLFSGDADVADYGLAKRCLALVNIAFVTLGQALMPFIAELYERKDFGKLERMVRGAATIVGLPCLLMAVVLFFGADLFATTVFGAERAGMAMPLRILLVGQAFLYIAGHGSYVLLMAGKQRELMSSTLGVLAAYAALLPLAIYWFGMAGAAIAKSLATAERAAAAAIITKRLLGIRTTAALSPETIRESLQQLRAGRRRKPSEDPGETEQEAAELLES